MTKGASRSNKVPPPLNS